ncbi:hypothetical protein MFRU_021g00270 [Monilinia fructicola]|uniref:Uncharacterized protein n=1 Tax=Monilinia fructicola TaxID=38448 RepID=A0A5M9KB35_MONFR|nr:hypothetical protein EYC84_007282 [Monilinia fructicola]KAG4028436.1 hypothetical protein MFRU_021g00270 [Monilinia fructicola]
MPDISRNRIEIWRNEVESQTSSQSGVTGDARWNEPTVRPPSFWRRIFGLGYGGSGSGSGSGNGSGSGSGDGGGGGSRSGSGRSASIGKRLGLVKEEIERTGMYTVRSRDKDEVGRGGGKVANGDRAGGSSMELDGSDESERVGLKGRRKRLERAAKLLGKNEGMGGNGQRG